jgi:hypothetical protein
MISVAKMESSPCPPFSSLVLGADLSKLEGHFPHEMHYAHLPGWPTMPIDGVRSECKLDKNHLLLDGHTNDIPASQVLMLGEEIDALRDILRLGENLYLDPFGAYVVESKLSPTTPLGVYPRTDSNDPVFHFLTRLEVAKIVDKVPQVIVDEELVRIGVRGFSLSELSYS